MRCTLLRLILALMLCASTVAAQERNIFLELGGSGGLGSFNYERAWIPSPKPVAADANCGTPDPRNFIFTLRTGFSLTPIDKNNGIVLIFPLMGNIVYGRNAHKLEAGAGVAPSVTTKGAFYIKSPAMVGYRFAPNDKRYFFRVNYTPIIGWWLDYQWQHWAGVSIGYQLRNE